MKKTEFILRIWLAAALLALIPAAAQPVGASSGAQQTRAALRLRSVQVSADFLVQAMLDQVQAADLMVLVDGLSGEIPLQVGGAPVTIATRSTSAALAISQATQFAYEYFQTLGLDTAYHAWSYYGSPRRNVTADQPGRTSTCLFLLTAHLDSTSTQAITKAPGADDNATGVAAVLTAAKILSTRQFTCTLRYVLFTGEEQGLLGSEAYALDAANRGEVISGVLNLDMLGYNSPNSAATFELDIRSGSEGVKDQVLSGMLSSVNQTYQLGLTPLVYASNESGSDHYSFWQRGYPAVLLIEDWDDHTPYYHTIHDQTIILDPGYFERMTRMVIGAAAHLARLVPPGRVFAPVISR